MVMIILSLEKKLKNTNKILESKIQSKSLLDGVSLQNNFEYLFDSYHSREDTSVSFSALVPPEPDLVHQYFLAAKMSQNFLFLWFGVVCIYQLFVSFHQ